MNANGATKGEAICAPQVIMWSCDHYGDHMSGWESDQCTTKCVTNYGDNRAVSVWLNY